MDRETNDNQGRESLELKSFLERTRLTIQTKPGTSLSGGVYDALPNAAVCVILRTNPNNESIETLMVKRSVSEYDPWSGHMAFPGGRADKNDAGLVETVKREVFEETAIVLSDRDMIGKLDEIVPGNFSLKVTPFVAIPSKPVEVHIDHKEIVDFFWIPVAFFQNKQNSSEYKVVRLGQEFAVPSFAYEGKHIVWGMSLRIIENLLEKVK